MFNFQNTILYMIIQYKLKELTAHIKDVAFRALESVNLPSHSLFIRCAEMLEYLPGGLLDWHVDTGSAYTMIIWLAEKGSYSGGKLLIGSTNEDTENSFYYSFNLEQGSGVIFKSNIMHFITPLTAGNRYVLVVEFWPDFESIIGHRRPDFEDEHLYDYNDDMSYNEDVDEL